MRIIAACHNCGGRASNKERKKAPVESKRWLRSAESLEFVPRRELKKPTPLPYKDAGRSLRPAERGAAPVRGGSSPLRPGGSGHRAFRHYGRCARCSLDRDRRARGNARGEAHGPRPGWQSIGSCAPAEFQEAWPGAELGGDNRPTRAAVEPRKACASRRTRADLLGNGRCNPLVERYGVTRARAWRQRP